jgi:HEAT repeat protein/MFS family permease
MRSWTVSSGLAAVYSAITTGAYSTGYALHLGATNAQVGFLSAASAWGQTLQLLTPLLIERLPQRRRLCLFAYALSYGVWLPVAFIPWLVPHASGPTAMIAFLAVGGAALAAASPASTSWLSDLVPARMRARFVSRQQMAVASVGLAAAIVAGRYMDAFPEVQQQTGFSCLFVVAVVFGIVALVVWARVPEPPKDAEAPMRFADLFRLPLGNRDLRQLTLFVAARTTVVMIAAPFFSVYMLQNLQVPYSLIAIFSGINTIAMIAANPIWAYLSDKFGYRPVLKLSALGLALVPLSWLFTTRGNHRVVIPLLMAWAGVHAAGVILAQFNLLVKMAPQEHRSVYIGFHAAVVSAASALGAMLGGWLGDLCERFHPLSLHGYPITNLHFVFLASALGRFGTIALLGPLREERATSTRELLKQVGSGHTLAAAWGLVRMAHSSDPASKADSVRALGQAHSALPVEELVASLDDSDRDVRREAARALGEIGDERAVGPLIREALDEASGISLDAIEALGSIRAPASRDFLIGRLESDQPAVREVAAVALGQHGAPEATGPLERLLDAGEVPTVELAAARALSRTAGPRALERLLELLLRTRSDVARRELATAIGDLIGRPGRFYRLLQADPMRQDETAARVLARCRRLIGRFPDPAPETTAADLEAALESFGDHDYAHTVRRLARAAVRTLGAAASTPRWSDAKGGAPRISALTAADEELRMCHRLLLGLHRGAQRPLTGVEGLLAVFAFQMLVDELAQGSRRNHG